MMVAADIVVKPMDFFTSTLLHAALKPVEDWLDKRGVKGKYLSIFLLCGLGTALLVVIAALAYFGSPR